ncbi:hypothetical protein [Dysgonomonas sp. 25]|uniref:hypothetical protein n=1 Tax=Dysgonomonas sp. 25 TaxID=2302933 RepID=UPI0013D69E60|nr:hypothetical protein [Dysgonomonas sp. 25]NDV67867.1 hypothetical protein [Dysgonomonas sp. 25]
MKKKKVKKKIETSDYIKAVKKADRELQLEQFVGWQRITKVHKSKKLYDRKREKKHFSEE